jgi:predicted DCC family thiol-disulfide oxidoreductase YuxK
MPHPYLLVYDGDCSLCLAWSRRLVRWAGLPDADRVSHHDLDPDLRARVEAAGLKNELKVVHRADGTITGGFEAIRRFGRGTGLAWLVVLSAVPPFRWLFPLGYGLIARNRRVLAPTPGGMVCACDPDPHLGYNLAFAVHAGASAALGWWMVIAVGGAVLADAPRVAWADALWKVPLVMASVVGAVGVPRGRRLTWANHLLWVQARAGLAFVAGSALALVARGAGWGRAVEIAAFAAGALGGLVVFLRGIRRHGPAMRALARAPALPDGGDPP